MRAARDRVDTLTAAIREVEKTIADLEAENVRLADEKQQAATVRRDRDQRSRPEEGGRRL